jgi:hypothetical protein
MERLLPTPGILQEGLFYGSRVINEVVLWAWLLKQLHNLREAIVTLILEFVSATLKSDGGLIIQASSRGADARIPMGATRVVGNTIGDPEVWKSASWWFAFRADGEFAIEVQGPTSEDETHGGGLSAVVVVTLPSELLPGFLARLGPNMDRSVSMEISPDQVTIS